MNLPALGPLVALVEGRASPETADRTPGSDSNEAAGVRFLETLLGALAGEPDESKPGATDLLAFLAGESRGGSDEGAGSDSAGSWAGTDPIPHHAPIAAGSFPPEPSAAGVPEGEGAETAPDRAGPGHEVESGEPSGRSISGHPVSLERSTGRPSVVDHEPPRVGPEEKGARGRSEAAPGPLARGAGAMVAASAIRPGVSGVDPTATSDLPTPDAPGARPAPGVEPSSASRTPDTSPGASVREAAAPPRADADPASADVGAADVTTPDRNLASLDPVLRDGIERVQERMLTEFGHRVEVVEGYRAPERQAHLFEQGRSRPGPVVTWTLESQHSRGRAADLQVDGGWKDPAAYGRLQRVAREEGLTTLGPRDPGHVQLARDAGAPEGTAPAAGTAMPEPGTWYGESSIARIAEVASVARPARVARVARTAVAGVRIRRGGSDTTPTGHEGETPTVRPEGSALGATDRVARAIDEMTRGMPQDNADLLRRAVVSRLDGSAADEGGGQRDRATSRLERPGFRTGRVAPAPQPTAAPDPAGHREPPESGPVTRAAEPADASATTNELLADGRMPSTAPDGVSPVREAAGVGSPNLSARVERIEALREAAGLAGPGEIRLDLDERDGLGARIRMALRGPSVGAVIDMDDPAVARRMQARIADLHRAMEARGLEPAVLDVRTVRSPSEAVEAVASSTGASDPAKSAANASSDRSEPGTYRQASQGEREQDRRAFREFRDGTQRDHRREQKND